MAAAYYTVMMKSLFRAKTHKLELDVNVAVAIRFIAAGFSL
jgi:hypothetical protein